MVTSEWVNGNLVFKDSEGNAVFTIEGSNKKVLCSCVVDSSSIAEVVTSTIPASGSCAVQFAFKDASGNAVSKRAMQFFISNSSGSGFSSVTGFSVLTNGAIQTINTGVNGMAILTEAGLLGMTITASSGTYYVSFITPCGTVLTSTAIVVN